MLRQVCEPLITRLQHTKYDCVHAFVWLRFVCVSWKKYDTTYGFVGDAAHVIAKMNKQAKRLHRAHPAVQHRALAQPVKVRRQLVVPRGRDQRTLHRQQLRVLQVRMCDQA